MNGLEQVPEQLRRALEQALDVGEHVVATFLPDLDEHQAFKDGFLALTEARLLEVRGADASPAVRVFPLAAITALNATDRGGLGTLEARGESALLARWHYTVGRAKHAAHLVGMFDRLRSGARFGPADAEGEPEIPEAIPPEEAPKVGTLFRLLRFARPHVFYLSLGVVLSLATTAASLIPPYLTWPLVDDVMSPYQEQVKVVREDPALTTPEKGARLEALREHGTAPFAKVPWYLAGMLGAAFLAWVLGWAQGWILARLSERVSADMRNTTYAHLHRMSIDYFSAKRTGDLVARISSDTDRICNFISDTLTDFVTDVLMIVGTAVMLFYMDPILALATLCTFPLVAWLTLFARNRLTQGFLYTSRAWGDMTAILADTIPGVRVVKAFAQERREINRFRGANDRIVAANDKVNRLWTFFWPMVALLNQLGLLVAWAVGAWRVFDQRITVGVLTAFLAYISRFYGRLESMTRMAGNTQRAAASAQRIFEVLDRTPSVPDPVRPVNPGRLKGT